MSRCENGRWGDGRCGHGHPQGTALHLPHQSPAERPGWSLAGRAADEQLLAWEHHHLTWLTSPFAINHRWTEAGWTRGEERSWAALLGLRWLPYRGAGGYGASSLPKHVSSTTLQHHSHETSSFILGFAIHSVVASVGGAGERISGTSWLQVVVTGGGEWWVGGVLGRKRLSRGCGRLKNKALTSELLKKEVCFRREAVHSGVKTWVSVGSRVRGLPRKHRAWIEGWFSWMVRFGFGNHLFNSDPLWLREESEASCTETGKGQGVEDKQEARARPL